jgi:hypothetical protein
VKEPIISIDRGSRSFAVFDGIDAVRGFERYESEENAIEIGKKFVAERTTITPEIVYPQIRSMRIAYGKRRKPPTP